MIILVYAFSGPSNKVNIGKNEKWAYKSILKLIFVHENGEGEEFAIFNLPSIIDVDIIGIMMSENRDKVSINDSWPLPFTSCQSRHDEHSSTLFSAWKL